ncbi:MAG: hypothetical protein PVG32_16470, partial [Anaerolineales bacterium]
MNSKSNPSILLKLSLILLTSLTACQNSISGPTGIPTSSHTQTAIETDINTASVTKTSVLPSETSTPSPNPSPPEFPIGGIEQYNLTTSDGWEIIKQTNAYWLRVNGLLWSEVEPVEGQRNWSAAATLEQELQKASDFGYQVILIIRSTPSWAQRESGIPCGPIKPDKLSAFVNFVSDAVTRYSTHPFNVKYWEIWNE